MLARAKNAHKGDNGKVLIVAGSRGMAGAAVLAAHGALRGGAGLVRIATVKSQQEVVVRRGPVEATTASLPESASGQLSAAALSALQKIIRDFAPDILAIGPGLGRSPAVSAAVNGLLRLNIPTVLDADGLNVFKGIHKGPLIITPHTGELARLLKCAPVDVADRRAASARLAAQRFRCVCLLKGHNTLITDGGRIWKNNTGNPGMASGGMGDVLTGLIAALWGQMLKRKRGSAIEAARMGAWVHGRAGDLAAKKFGEIGFLASDLAMLIPSAINMSLRGTK